MVANDKARSLIIPSYIPTSNSEVTLAPDFLFLTWQYYLDVLYHHWTNTGKVKLQACDDKYKVLTSSSLVASSDASCLGDDGEEVAITYEIRLFVR